MQGGSSKAKTLSKCVFRRGRERVRKEGEKYWEDAEKFYSGGLYQIGNYPALRKLILELCKNIKH